MTLKQCQFFFQVIYPKLLGITPDPVKIQKLEQEMSSCLDSIETLWLSQNRYIAGNEISVADLFAACEIEQPSAEPILDSRKFLINFFF